MACQMAQLRVGRKHLGRVLGRAGGTAAVARRRQGLWRWWCIRGKPVASAAVALGWFLVVAAPLAGCAQGLGQSVSGLAVPQLSRLGAPPKTVGSGLVSGVTWRVQMTPPASWTALNAAGFDLGAMSGGRGSCVLGTTGSRNAYAFFTSCEAWPPQVTLQPGQPMLGGCTRYALVTICNGDADPRVDHFVLVLADGTRLTLVPAHFRGHLFVAFAFATKRPALSLIAFSAHGKQLTTSSTF
jgi:hypothetical protein